MTTAFKKVLKTHWVLASISGLFLVSIVYLNNVESEHNNLVDFRLTQPSKIWISMSLCWGSKVDLLQKADFPYALAGQLSTQLWPKMSNNNTTVMFTIVVCDNAGDDSTVEGYTLNQYIKVLQDAGALVKISRSKSCDNKLSCVLQAQLVRLLAFQYNEVEDNDVIVMSDVDTFPAKKSILDPIIRNKDKSVWVFRYDTSVKFGFTFSMSFIGMRSALWRQVLENPDTVQDLVGNFQDRLELDQLNTTWDYDQLIVTRAILESKLCTFPRDSQKLWSMIKMSPPDTEQDDWETCYRGANLVDCHRNYVVQDCRHWHFMPYERKTELLDKYHEILGETKPEEGMHLITKNVKFELARILGFRS